MTYFKKLISLFVLFLLVFKINAAYIPSNGQANKLYVDKLGADATAVRGDITKPFLTGATASTIATNGDLIILGMGSFTLGNITNGVSIQGQGVGQTSVGGVACTSNASIANMTLLAVTPAPITTVVDNLTINNVLMGTPSGIDCIRVSGGTNVLVNNSTFYGCWDIDPALTGSTWNYDTEILSDAPAPNFSFGMHAHYITLDNSSLIVNGGVVSMNSTRPTNYFTLPGMFNAFLGLGSTNFTNVTVRLNGPLFRHYQAVGAPPCYMFYGLGSATNILGWWWDMDEASSKLSLCGVVGTNITSIAFNGSVATNLVNGIAQTFPLSALANDGGNPKNTIMIGSLQYNYGCIGWDFSSTISIVFPVDWRPFIPSILNGATNFYLSVPVYTTNKNMSISVNPICFIETNSLDGISPNGYVNLGTPTNFSFTGPGTNFYRLNIKFSIPQGLLTNAAMVSFGVYNNTTGTNFAIPSYGGSLSNWTQ